MNLTDETLAAHYVLVQRDSAFQRTARLRQARWREKMGYPIGEHRGAPLGSRLAMPFAEETLVNYVNEAVRRVVRAEVAGGVAGTGKLYREPRIFNDLLSSQPLCFNLFAELQLDLDLASKVLGHCARIADVQVIGIEFEYSPGRGNSAFTRDSSAFDVFIRYRHGAKSGFVGLEVKYVENMEQLPARFRPRYLEVARESGVFKEDRLEEVRRPPLDQLWREHLLAISLRLHAPSGFDEGRFVVLAPEENLAVKDAVARYGDCLRDRTSFDVWTLEGFLHTVQQCGAGPWATAVEQRYLGGDLE